LKRNKKNRKLSINLFIAKVVFYAFACFLVLVLDILLSEPSEAPPGRTQDFSYLGSLSVSRDQSLLHTWLLYHGKSIDCTDKKENQIFLIYKEIQRGAVAKS
jgi:hypothetical protein